MGNVRRAALLIPLASSPGGLETINKLCDLGILLAVEGSLLEISRLRLVFVISFLSKGVSSREGGIVTYQNLEMEGQKVVLSLLKETEKYKGLS